MAFLLLGMSWTLRLRGTSAATAGSIRPASAMCRAMRARIAPEPARLSSLLLMISYAPRLPSRSVRVSIMLTWILDPQPTTRWQAERPRRPRRLWIQNPRPAEIAGVAGRSSHRCRNFGRSAEIPSIRYPTTQPRHRTRVPRRRGSRARQAAFRALRGRSKVTVHEPRGQHIAQFRSLPALSRRQRLLCAANRGVVARERPSDLPVATFCPRI